MEEKEKIIVKEIWKYPLAKKETSDLVSNLSKKTGLSLLETTILYNRGYTTEIEIKKFLNLDFNSLHDPRLLKDAEKFVDVIIDDINKHNKAVLVSDYDYDGFGCVQVAYPLLSKAGLDIEWFTNTRKIGYGLKTESVDIILDKWPTTKTIITSDNGIKAFEAIEYAKTKGIKVIVSDHHEPEKDGTIPNCSAVVDPKRLDETYPFDGLCGTGVIYKLCRLLYEKLGLEVKDCDEYLDFVASATIADVVPLKDENRVLVNKGLELINKETKPIWSYVRQVWNPNVFGPSIVNSKTIGWTYGPTINAYSRLLGDMDLPIKTFLIDSTNKANMVQIKKNLSLLYDINQERKSLSTYQTEEVEALINNLGDMPAYVVWMDSITEGIAGIIAGRIADRIGRPTIVVTNSDEHPDIYKGSGRSIKGFNIEAVLSEIQKESNLLEAFGGHEGACGLTIKKENLSEFRLAMVVKADEIVDAEASRTTQIDLVLNDLDFDIKMFDSIKSLEPYGQEFREPILGLKDFSGEASTMGNNKQHIKIKGTNIDYVCWHSSKLWEALGKPDSNLSCIGNLEFNSFQKKLQLTGLNPDSLRINNKEEA